MILAQTIVFIYGLFTFVGGIIGFLKAHSKASLIVGSISGILLLICTNGIGKGSTASYVIASLISLILGIRFFKTWRIKKKVMPDLIMVVLSLLSLVAIIYEVAR